MFPKSNLIKDLDGKVYRLDKLYLGEKIEVSPEELGKYDMSASSGFLDIGNGKYISEIDLICEMAKGKIDPQDFYTKLEVDEKLLTKVNAGEVYTKLETYTKEEVNQLLANNDNNASMEELKNYLHKINDKATLTSFNESSDSHFVTPMMTMYAIKKMSESGEINPILAVNGKTGDVVLTREDLELGNVINQKQATKVEFDNHVADPSVHMAPEERNNMFIEIGRAFMEANKKIDKARDKATVPETVEGIDDEKFVTPKGLVALVDEILGINLTKNVQVYELKDFGFDGIIAEVLNGQTFYSNKEIIVNDITINEEPKIANENIIINSKDCTNFENVYLFVK